MSKVLLINGHPDKESYCEALTTSYMRGAAAAGNEVCVLTLSELKFNLSLEHGYNKNILLEPDLVYAQEKISWASHIVIIHPVWWGSVPAILKGFLDRTLLPGFAFKYKRGSLFWNKFLTGKSAHIIYTTDTPVWYYNWVYGAPSVNMLKRRVLNFCGISPVKITGIGPIRRSSESFRNNWLIKVEKLGRRRK